MFKMEYNKFIESSFRKIKLSREAALGIQIQAKVANVPSQSSNIYIELLAHKDEKMVKIEQWNFISLKNLISSEYAESEDPELDSVELKKKHFFDVLEEKLKQFNPKLLIKYFASSKLLITLKIDEESLIPFLQENYLIEIYDYEGLDFNSHVSLKTIHQEMPGPERGIALMSSEQQFEILVDSAYQRQKNDQPQAEITGNETPAKMKLEQHPAQLTENEKQIEPDPQNSPSLVENQQMRTQTKQVSLLQKGQILLKQAEKMVEQFQYDSMTLEKFLQKLIN